MPIRFQVDPDFYDHPKAIGMSDSATALWVRAGSYSAAKLTDGFVAETALSLLSRCPAEAASELVARGLWRRVRGGYQFHQYAERNLTRARVEADREADRNRKRASRHVTARETVCDGCGDTYVTARSDSKYCSQACRQRAYRNNKPQVVTEVVHPESKPESERNPGGIRPVSVSVSVSESVSGSGHDSPATQTQAALTTQEPPPRCPQHIDDENPPPCGACADARRTHERWETDQAQTLRRAEQARRSADARRRAQANADAIAACRMCDQRGYLPTGRQCGHDPGRVSGRGAAAARAVLDQIRATPPTTEETP